jgi:hypothetical protein
VTTPHRAASASSDQAEANGGRKHDPEKDQKPEQVLAHGRTPLNFSPGASTAVVEIVSTCKASDLTAHP